MKKITGRTDLMEAVINHDKTKIESLLAQGAEINVINEDRETPLNLAVMFSDKDEGLVELLLRNGADPNTFDNSKPGFEDSILSSLITFSYKKETIELLLDQGGDVNIKDKMMGAPALFKALEKNRFDIIELFCQKGVDLDCRDYSGQNVLCALDTFNTFLGGRALKILLANGMSANKTYSECQTGETLMHTAARYGQTELMVILMEHGGDMNAADEHTYPPIHQGLNNENVLTLLVANGADVDIKNPEGNTPIMAAIKYCDYESSDVVKFILDYSEQVPDLLIKNQKGETALEMARNKLKGLDTKSKNYDEEQWTLERIIYLLKQKMGLEKDSPGSEISQ